METDKLNELNPLFLHRIRLGICALLSETEFITFPRFKELLKASDGNLGAQLKILKDKECIISQEFMLMRKKATWFSLTERGKKELTDHLKILESIIEMAAAGKEKQ